MSPTPTVRETSCVKTAIDHDEEDAEAEGGEEETPENDPEVKLKGTDDKATKANKKPDKLPVLKRPAAKKAANFVSERTTANGWVVQTFRRSSGKHNGGLYYKYCKHGVGSFYSLNSARDHGYEP